MTQGFFILWNTAKQHFTFRLTGQILPQGSIPVMFVKYESERGTIFSHTSEVPSFVEGQSSFYDVGNGSVEWADMDCYVRFVLRHLYLVDGVLSTSFMFKALEPVPDTESIPAPEPEVPFQGNQPNDLIVSEDGELVQEI